MGWYNTQTLHGTTIYADQLGWYLGGQWGGSPMAVPSVVFGSNPRSPCNLLRCRTNTAAVPPFRCRNAGTTQTSGWRVDDTIPQRSCMWPTIETTKQTKKHVNPLMPSTLRHPRPPDSSSVAFTPIAPQPILYTQFMTDHPFRTPNAMCYGTSSTAQNTRGTRAPAPRSTRGGQPGRPALRPGSSP